MHPDLARHYKPLRPRKVFVAWRDDDPVYQDRTILGIFTEEKDAEQAVKEEFESIRANDLDGEADVIVFSRFAFVTNPAEADEDEWQIDLGVDEEWLYER